MSTSNSPGPDNDARADILERLARALRTAERTGVAISPIRDELDPSRPQDAYTIQQLNVVHAVASGRRIAGRKIGLTNLKVQQQLGVNEPDFGTLFADMIYGDDDPVPFSGLLQPKAEAEVALVLNKDITRNDATLLDVIEATDYVLPAIEIVDSRIANWDIRFIDTVADNASSGCVVLGAVPVSLRNLDLKQCRMSMSRNAEESASTGNGGACLGHPLNAAVWLARKLASLGQPLRAGDLVLTGALGPMIPVGGGDRLQAHIGGVGTVCAQLSSGDET